MEIGYETIGNATLVCHDRVPVLWIIWQQDGVRRRPIGYSLASYN
jgi:hypothetical protein